MRMVTTTYPVYRFNELSKAAKEKVREWYSAGQSPEIFTMQCEEDMHYNLFPQSDLHVEYSIGYCQGDGLNIYGKIYLDELLEKITENFTENELEWFNCAFNLFGSAYNMPYNCTHYSYCICDRHDYMEDLRYDLECAEMDYSEFLLEKFNKAAQEYMSDLCAAYEKDGYYYFYEFDDSDLEEACDANEWEFTEDGEIA